MNQQPTILMDRIGNDQVAIDGIIYDTRHFDHPGGKEALSLWGGNDVSILFRMVHSQQASSPQHLYRFLSARLKVVGRLKDSKQTEYEFFSPFEKQLKREVFSKIRMHQERVLSGRWDEASMGWWFRATIYLTCFAILQFIWTTQGSSYLLAVLLGISKALIGLNVQHDANHGTVSRRYPLINQILGFGADWIGGNKYLWNQQHFMHHGFTNHPDHDPDVLPPCVHSLFRFVPAWVSLFPLVSLYWFYQVFSLSSLWNLEHPGAKQAGLVTTDKFRSERRVVAMMMRLLYIYTNIVRPFQVTGGLSWHTLGQICLMGMSGSLLIGTLFSLSHHFEEISQSTRTTAVTGKSSGGCWYQEQVEASCSYGGFLASWLTGGLNYQIEHHLFPRMNSAWYPVISDTVKRVCKEHKVRYTSFSNIGENLHSTLQILHRQSHNSQHNTDQASCHMPSSSSLLSLSSSSSFDDDNSDFSSR